jgi:PAS domain S-box-containing protein
MRLSDRLTHLGDILIELSASPVPSQQFKTLADESGNVLTFDYLGVCLLDPEEQGYRVHSLVGTAGNAMPERLYGLDEGVVGLVLRTGRTSLCDDVGAHPQATADIEGVARQMGLRAALVLPVRQTREVIGAIYFAAQPPTVYDHEDMQVASLLSAGLSSAMEMSRLYQSLADERSVLAAVLASTTDGIVVVNTLGQVLLVNPAAARLLGLPAETLAGERFSEIIAAVQEKTAAAPELMALLESGDTERTVELALVDGRVAHASLVQVTTAFGEAVGAALVIHDVTMQHQLAQMKNEFVQTVSHDLKNPITSISLAGDVLARTGQLSEGQQDALDQIRETTAYMGELVSDLLELGRIEAGLGLSVSQVDMVRLAREVIGDLYSQIEAASLTVALEGVEGITVSGDRERLRRVLVNLLDNAVKYTPAGGEIVVSVVRNSARAITRVSDNGLGIPESSLPHIFDKFYRVKSAATAGITGTGLGLAIARSIVEAHDGRMWVESAEREGSTFAFTMPLATAPNG